MIRGDARLGMVGGMLREPIAAKDDPAQRVYTQVANRRSAEQRLSRVETALRRMEEGEYGDCRECGESIALARLEAQPEAPLCVQCQELRERQLNSR